MHVLIVGGGVFGLTTAIVLGEQGHRVTVIEKNKDVMIEASMVNQNRIHFGYHYPRSRATCEESLAGLATFKEFYGDAINYSFQKFYAVSKESSHVSPAQFEKFCADMGLPLEEKWPEDGIVNKELLASSWLTPEPIFDFNVLRNIILKRIARIPQIKILTGVQISAFSETASNKEVKLSDGSTIHCDVILNASYAGISDVLHSLKRERIQAKYQWCVMPILEMDQPPAPFGVTIMDGPFCSLMPKGFERNRFILYHVVHSVRAQQVAHTGLLNSADELNAEQFIFDQSLRYYPILEKMRIVDSWKTTRIVLPESEKEDARPTLFIDNGNNVYSIFSGKLTTCVDAARQVLNKISSL